MIPKTVSQHQTVTPYRDIKTMSRRQMAKLCRDREDSVATGFSPTLKHCCRDARGHVSTQTIHDTTPPCRDTECPLLPQHPVVTLGSLSQHRVSHPCRDRASSIATKHLRRLVTTGLPRHASACACIGPQSCAQACLLCTPQSLLSRHHRNVMTQSWKWAVAHPIRTLHLFLSFKILQNQHKIALLPQRPLEPEKLVKMYLSYKNEFNYNSCSLHSTKLGFLPRFSKRYRIKPNLAFSSLLRSRMSFIPRCTSST